MPTRLSPLPPLKPELHERAWSSTPHPTLPLLATTHSKSVTIFSLSSLFPHSTLSGGHTRSVRSASWKPALPSGQLCLVTASFDSTAGIWRWTEDEEASLEKEITADAEDAADKDWEFTLVLEGHDSEIKACAFSPAGNLLATCSRDKSLWIWEDIGPTESADEWETIAVLTEHEGDVKHLAWCPPTSGRDKRKGVYSVECLASASYDDTARIWREDGDAEWVCVAVLEGHGGTVWGIEWEGSTSKDAFPRLLSYSADGTLKVWTLREEEDDEDGDSAKGGVSALGGIPNTMRRSLREIWTCTATLPTVHKGDVYNAAWSPITGLIASVGSDGVLALYQEGEDGQWQVLDKRENAHGPFEVNHVTWCKRWDGGIKPERRGVDEMLITTGDDGVVRPWGVTQPA